MNDVTLTHLKVLVERAVRPVRASITRKRRMREELLAHVSAVFEEEAARHCEERTALEQTEQRFGNPADLTGQLHDSVPVSDCIPWFLDCLVGFRLNESTLRRAGRYSLLAFLLFGGSILPALFVQGRLSEWPIAFSAPVLAFGFTFLTHWMRQALYGPAGRSWGRVLLVAAASWLLLPCVQFGLCLAFSGNVWSSFTGLLPVFPLAVVLTPLAVVGFVQATAGEIRYHQEWASLQIG